MIRDACVLLRDDADCPFNFLADVTCVDWFPPSRDLKSFITCFRFLKKSGCG